MRARTVVATTSMWGHIDGLSKATEVSVRGKCGKYGWVPSGGSVVFGQVSLSVGELHRFELVKLSEDCHWLSYGINLHF